MKIAVNGERLGREGAGLGRLVLRFQNFHLVQNGPQAVLGNAVTFLRLLEGSQGRVVRGDGPFQQPESLPYNSAV